MREVLALTDAAHDDAAAGERMLMREGYLKAVDVLGQRLPAGGVAGLSRGGGFAAIRGFAILLVGRRWRCLASTGGWGSTRCSRPPSGCLRSWSAAAPAGLSMAASVSASCAPASLFSLISGVVLIRVR